MAKNIEYRDNTNKILELFKSAKTRGLEAIGLVAEGHAKKITPVDTGRLRNSISHATDDEAAYIGTNVEYGPYVELGSPTIKAHHMLQKAATEHTDEYKRLMEDSMKNA